MNTLKEMLSKLKNEEVHVLLNNGNCGDGLIHMGGRKLFSDIGLHYTEIVFPEKATGKTLLVYGCGGFSRIYHHMPAFINNYMSAFEEIIILPASFDSGCFRSTDFLENLPEKVQIGCREVYSYEHVLAHTKFKKNCFLSPDLAFYLDYSNWKFKGGNGSVYAFRTDGESLFTCAKTGNIDFSARGNHTQGERLLESISVYDEIHTNRAHVGIAAAMLEKQVHFYPSIYYKQKGIYEYSLATFSTVHWHETLPEDVFSALQS